MKIVDRSSPRTLSSIELKPGELYRNFDSSTDGPFLCVVINTQFAERRTLVAVDTGKEIPFPVPGTRFIHVPDAELHV